MRNPFIIACLCATILGDSSVAASNREELLAQLKGRYNYASSDCAARVLASNKGCKSPQAILHSAMDTYLRNLCSYDDKHVVIELCQDIRVDTIVLSNFEYFSSMVKDFRVSVSKKYPPAAGTGWRLVGTFVGENSRREQVFLVEGKGYARYLRMDFDSHHGNEYYCLLSVLRVYGKTMMEDFEESNTKEQEVNNGSSADEPQSEAILGDLKREATTLTAQVPSQEKIVLEEGETVGPAPLSSDVDTSASSFDLWKLFQSQASDYCKATFSAPSATATMSADSFEAPMLPQENIFKAIHDRLQVLERNMTRSAKSFEMEIRRMGGELESVKGEIGVTSNFSSVNPKSSTFRAKLLQHLERKNYEFSAKLLDDIEDTLEKAESNGRIVFWLAILTFLQITGLLSVVVTGYLLGWFGPTFHHHSRLASTSNGLMLSMHNESHHQRRRSTSDLSMAMDDGLVPDQETFHGMSPAKSDLLTNARPLLLDESEAEIIDAVFLPTPVSSPSAAKRDSSEEVPVME